MSRDNLSGGGYEVRTLGLILVAACLFGPMLISKDTVWDVGSASCLTNAVLFRAGWSAGYLAYFLLL